MAELSSGARGDLDDGDFLYVEPGKPKKDGKTEDKYRHLPYKRHGKVDQAHVRAALGGDGIEACDAPGLTAEKKASLKAKCERLLKEGDKENSLISILDLGKLLSDAAAGVQNSSGASGTVPAENWYQVDLAGKWEGHPAGAYKLTPADIRCIVDYFNRTCKANSVDLPVDYEHQGVIAKLLGKSAEVGGWINALEARNGDTELWAHIAWVEDARALIQAKKFRYLSSHLTPDYKDPISGKLIPWVLQAVALTNRPFKKELPAVANATGDLGLGSSVAEEEDGAMDKLLALLAAAMSLDAKAVANSLGVPEDAQADATVKAIAGLLAAGDRASKQLKLFANAIGVAETADEAAISAALAAKTKPVASDADTKILAICNALGTTPDKTLAELLALLGSTRADPKRIEAEKMIENAVSVEHKITPANRQSFLDWALKDLEAAKKAIAGMPSVLNSATDPSKSETGSGAAVLTDADKRACQQHGIMEADFLATKKKLAG